MRACVLHGLTNLPKRTVACVLIILIAFILAVILAAKQLPSLNILQRTFWIAFTILSIGWFITIWTRFGGLHKRLSARGKIGERLADYLVEVSPELFGAILTTILFTVIVGSAQQSQAEADLKAQLIRQLGSRVNTETVRASEELRAHGWLEDGTLQGVNLADANLQGVALFHANLSDVELDFADLRGSSLSQANLQRASINFADLRDANLGFANFQGAYLFDADLRGAYLTYTVLQDADLTQVNLSGTSLLLCDLRGASLLDANLEGAILASERELALFDQSTILPDGGSWTLAADMTRFTDPNHPNFWRSDNPESPAYRAPSN